MQQAQENKKTKTTENKLSLSFNVLPLPKVRYSAQKYFSYDDSDDEETTNGEHGTKYKSNDDFYKKEKVLYDSDMEMGGMDNDESD